MKRLTILKAVLAVVVLTAFSKQVVATEKVVIDTYRNTNYAIISAALSPTDNYKVSIKSSSGTTLFSVSLSENTASFQKLFDLSQLANGNYAVVFDGKEKDVVSHFKIEDRKLVSIKKSNDADILNIKTAKSYIRQADDLIYVTHQNPELRTSYLEIYDNEGDSVYSSSLPNKKAYSGLYKINTLPRGEYKMVLTSGSKIHTYDFQK